MNVMEILHWIPVIVMLFIVGCLFVGFFKKYWKPAKNLKAVLDAALNEVKSNTQHQYLASTLKHNLTEYFKDTPFTHAWQMYQQTLHDSYKQIDGENQLVSTRSTVPSGYFFEQSTLVDTPLKVDFYKHLPGIITGLAIVATFSGLFIGLWSFDPAGDPANIQTSLKALLQSVMAAFIASGLAIFIAMLITWKEKAWLRECYATLEQLTTAIDKLFDADDIGEEYLDRLVHRVESTETAIKNIKDSLIDDLKPAIINGLGDMVSQLIESNRTIQAESARHMAHEISQSINSTFEQPLKNIAEAVTGVSQDQGNAVHDMLSEVLQSFMAQFQGAIGGQMQNLADMMGQSVTAISDMQTGFRDLIQKMQTTSEESSQRLQEKMVEILSGIEQKQFDMTKAIEAALEEMKHSVKNIGDMGVTATSEITENIGQVNASMDALLKQLNQNITQLSNTTADNIKQMNLGAEKMDTAAQRFTTAGQILNKSQDAMSTLLNQANSTAESLKQSSQALNDTHNKVNTAMQTINNLMQENKQESDNRQKSMQAMQTLLEQFKTVNQEMQNYVGKINDVLSGCFKTFSDASNTSLSKTLSEYDKALSGSVDRLKEATSGLSDVVEDIDSAVIQLKRRG